MDMSVVLDQVASREACAEFSPFTTIYSQGGTLPPLQGEGRDRDRDRDSQASHTPIPHLSSPLKGEERVSRSTFSRRIIPITNDY